MHPLLFTIGSIPIRSYGVMVLAGFLLGLWYAMSMARRRMKSTPASAGVITPDNVFDMALIGLFICIIGARVLYVALDWGEFRARPLDALRIWTGGLSIHGSIISGILWLAWYCRRHRIPFLAFADICAPAFALGYAIGRVGCFLNGCCYGHACDLPWAVRFLKDGQAGVWTDPSHPTQLYATALNLLWFVLLNRWLRRSHRNGEVFVGYLGLYCVYRFIDEQFRKGATADIFVAGLTHAQFFSIAALPIIAYFFWRIRTAPARPDLPDAAPPASAPAGR